MTEQPDVPVPAPQTVGPPCTQCGVPACVHWQRRLTDDELGDYLALVQHRRDELTELADPQLPPPDFGPMPCPGDVTRAVYACVDHAISIDAASLIHAKSCTAPPCNCTPEPAPQSEPEPEPQQLPPGWG
ncbi:hypothetical protein N4G70_28880 [Streptomyces sp. ASQP_92]|uniref:hypothetical protein n=1 Tax=Streptomyces sp. ASQP_92 TaxID=2979116 RepID=UPI0021C21501|nr:hypothetical protein [Streptomyces sp. ASQP_92]MCT9092855.1 hypothetical protein [Streptomyces sp. ASQP_92]